MRPFFISVFLIINYINTNSQPKDVDSIIQLLEKTPRDTSRVNLLLNISSNLYFYKPDRSLEYSTQALELSKELRFTEGILSALRLAGEASRLIGDYPGSLKFQFEALEINRKLKNFYGAANNLMFIGVTYMSLKEYREAVSYLLQSNSTRPKTDKSSEGVFMLANTGITYNFLNMPDSALYYLQLANERNKEIRHPQLSSLIPRSIGQVFANIGKRDSALHYYRIALNISIASNESINTGSVLQQIAEVYERNGNYDSTLHYVRSAFSEAQRTSQKLKLLESSSLLVRVFRARHILDSAFFYEDIVSAIKDSLYGTEKLKQLQLLMLAAQKKQQEKQLSQERYIYKTKMLALWATVGAFLIIMFILYKNNRNKQKTNKVLVKTLSDLKSTQSQLIQSEKMASLGELTAGIAHEIQNPLNFVNNFSEVNSELIAEMKEEINKGNLQEIKSIADSIDENERKINFHGKRADAIVKGMLQHSRNSTGQKASTDINALCDEYLRLAYHGLRAKDKTFNAEIKTEFDNSIGSINVVPQDIGRVILNLINNALYAVNDKAKLQTAGYQPQVSVSTKNHGDKIQIGVKDNGNGIPVSIKEKIFQPFFTTKPTGQGTGLGLSLSYDIIKAHGGEIKVESMEGQGTQFIILLPTD